MSNRNILTSGLCAVTVMAAFCSHAASNDFETSFYAVGKVGTEEMRAEMDVNTKVHATDLIFVDIHKNITYDDVTLHKNYAMGNAGLGWNWVMFDRWVLGIEGSGNIVGDERVTLHSLEDNDVQIINPVTGQPAFPIDNTSLLSEYEVAFTQPDLNADLRLGFLVTPNFLLYARAGAAFSEVEQEVESTYQLQDLLGLNNTVTLNASDSDDIVGFRAGLGGEYKVTDRIGVTLDYIYTNYGTVDIDSLKHDNIFHCTPSVICDGSEFQILPLTLSSDVDTELSKQTFMLGGTVYFGGGKKSAPVYYYGPDK